jgi:hypothetical protein
MATLREQRTHTVPTCPHCRRDPIFVCSWTYRGRWGYNEVHTYECSVHGPIFVGPERAVGRAVAQRSQIDLDDRDRDAFVSASRKPTPTLNANAIAIPEPDSD